VEGVADVLTFAALFQLLGRAGGGGQAWRMGLGATVLVGGLGAGAVAGGIAVRAAGMDPTVVFALGAGACLLTAIGAWVGSRSLLPHESPAPETASGICASGPVWPMLLMAASDRATGAALTAVFASFLARNLGYDPVERGRLVGLPLLLMAIGATPAGWIADRLGSLRVRTWAAWGYATCFAAVALVGASTATLSLLLLALGVTAAPLLPSSLALTVRSGHGTRGLAAFRVAGDMGYFLGLIAVIGVGALAGADELSTQRALMVGFALLHAACTAAAWSGMRRVPPTPASD
jgi:hypothetical protein